MDDDKDELDQTDWRFGAIAPPLSCPSTEYLLLVPMGDRQGGSMMVV